jgi:hypothetical protein
MQAITRFHGRTVVRSAATLAAAVCAPMAIAVGHAQDDGGRNEIADGIRSSFALPLDELLRPHGARDNAGVSLRLAFDYPLSQAEGDEGLGQQGARSPSPTLQAALRYTPLTYWFASLSLYRYLEPQRQQSWNPDFGYAFGYDDWHPYTFSLTYGNNGGNRVNPKAGESVTHFDQGTWSLGFKFPLPEALKSTFTTGNGDAVGCVTAYSYTPRYSDSASNGLKSGKQVATLGCRYSMPGWWYVNATAYLYPDAAQRQPWDPDFTYGFGRFDWHPGELSIQYNNYSADHRLRSGSVVLSWSTSW